MFRFVNIRFLVLPIGISLLLKLLSKNTDV